MKPASWSASRGRQMDSFLWWSGVVAWGAAGSVGIWLGLDWAVDEVANSLNFKRQFLAFVWDRLKSKQKSP